MMPSARTVLPRHEEDPGSGASLCSCAMRRGRHLADLRGLIQHPEEDHRFEH